MPGILNNLLELINFQKQVEGGTNTREKFIFQEHNTITQTLTRIQII